MILNKRQIEAIEEKVKTIESKTVSELVPLIVLRSTPHFGFEVKVIFSITFLSLFLVALYDELTVFPLNLSHAFLIFVSLQFLFLLILKIPRFEKALIHKAVLAKAVHDRTLIEFHKEKLSETKHRTGVLLLISLFERRVHVLADTAYRGVISTEEWKKITDHSAKLIAKNQLFEAVIESLDHMEALLVKYFPSAVAHSNELNNELKIKK